MLINSQPLNEEISAKFSKYDKEIELMTEENIVSLRIGSMFDDYRERKIGIETRFKWLLFDVGLTLNKIKYAFRNHFVWRKTLSAIRPWEGFYGMIQIINTHLVDYIKYEETHGHSTDEYKNKKIDTARETITILKKLENPTDYFSKRTDEVAARYPKYKQLISRYKYGGCGFSGNFIAQENGWTGEESGRDPRKGYFEIHEGRFELAKSPNQHETDKLLEQLDNYSKDKAAAYEQAIIDAENDFDHLGQLLKENLFTWWD